MLLLTDTELSIRNAAASGRPTNLSQHCHITWFENLLRGIKFFILHPFLPFYDHGFNYQCLFSHKGQCCSTSDCVQVDSNQVDSSILNRGTDGSFIESFGEFIKLIVSKYIQSTSRTNVDSIQVNRTNLSATGKLIAPLDHVGRFLLAQTSKLALVVQLVLCTIALSYHVARDLNNIVVFVSRMRKRRILIEMN